MSAVTTPEGATAGVSAAAEAAVVSSTENMVIQATLEEPENRHSDANDDQNNRDKTVDAKTSSALPAIYNTVKHDNENKPTASNIAGGGYYLRWHRLCKVVEVKDASRGLLSSSIADAGRRSSSSSRHLRSSRSMSILGRNAAPKTKVILNEVSGCAAPGEVLALMGPSGSGKTSLLNTLSGRSSYQEGVVSINGRGVHSTLDMKRLMAKIAYVKQADIFFGHLTVQDQFMYTALLRMPSSKTREEKQTEVQRIMKLLRLSHVAESPIKMLSGGEKKRVNIGTELLTDPLLLLLDEPSSGLDSTSAVSLLQLLHRLARGNPKRNQQPKTIITSIHQPSSAVFRSFDKLLMLSGGHAVYFGSPIQSLEYLRAQNVPCPDGYNTADHWMDLLVIDNGMENSQHDRDGDNEEDDGGDDANNDNNNNNNTDEESELLDFSGESRIQLEEAWDNEAVAREMDAALVDEGAETNSNRSSTNRNSILSTDQLTTKRTSKYSTSWTTQYWVLTHRCLKNSRSAIFTPLNLTKSVCIGLVAGLLWFQMEWTEERVRDRSAYYFFTMTYWVFDSMFGALLAFPSEKSVILKERASGSYHLSAYFMAKTSSDAPVRLTLPFLYMITSFWMSGVDDRFTVFLSSTCCTLLSVTAGEALGLLIGASIYNMEKAMTVMIIGALTLMLLGGFYVQTVPVFVAWVKYLSPFKYAFDASLQLVFSKEVPCDGSGNLEDICGGLAEGYAQPDQVVSFLGVQGSIGFNVGMLIVICLVPRYGAYLALRRQKSGDRT